MQSEDSKKRMQEFAIEESKGFRWVGVVNRLRTGHYAYKLGILKGYEKGMVDPEAGRESLLGKYKETSPEGYADSCDNVSCRITEGEMRALRIEAYSQGFFDCEMAHGPHGCEDLLQDSKESLEKLVQGFRDLQRANTMRARYAFRKRLEDRMSDAELTLAKLRSHPKVK